MMPDKRGKWSKENLRNIWNNYVNNDNLINKVKKKHKLDLNGMNFDEKAPCYWCGKIMIRAQYQGIQPDKKASWDVDHDNSNPRDNSAGNLVPMHPWCNKEKG